MENNLTLYQLNEELDKLGQELIDSCDKDTGEIDRELLAKYECLKMKKEDKLKGCIYLVHKFTDYIELCDKEIKRIKALKEKYETANERIENLLTYNVEPGKKLDLGTVSIGWRKSTSLYIQDEEARLTEIETKIRNLFTEFLNTKAKDYFEIIHELAPYIKIKITCSFDKMALKDDIKNGMKFDSIFLEEKDNIQIK